MITQLNDVEVTNVVGGQDYLIVNNSGAVQISAADQTLGAFIKVLGQLATTPPGEIPGIDVVPLF